MTRVLFFSFLLFTSSLVARVPLSESQVMECVGRLPLSGTLERSSDFLFVKIDDCFIYDVLSLIEREGFSSPPYFGEGRVGAHISIAFPNELEKIPNIPECGSKVSFTLRSCEVIQLQSESEILAGIDELYLLVIDAPELDALREKYGLPKSKYPFHITLGAKQKECD